MFRSIKFVYAVFFPILLSWGANTEAQTKAVGSIPHDLPAKCAKKWDLAVKGKEASALMSFFDYVKAKDPKNDCLKAESAYIAKTTISFMDKTCAKEIPGPCVNAFLFYRAAVIDQMNSDETEDAAILYNKVLAGHTSARLGSQEFIEKRLKMIEKLRAKIGSDNSLNRNLTSYLGVQFDTLIDQKNYELAKKLTESPDTKYVDPLISTYWKALALSYIGKQSEAINVLKNAGLKEPTKSSQLDVWIKSVNAPAKLRSLAPDYISISFNTSFI